MKGGMDIHDLAGLVQAEHPTRTRREALVCVVVIGAVLVRSFQSIGEGDEESEAEDLTLIAGCECESGTGVAEAFTEGIVVDDVSPFDVRYHCHDFADHDRLHPYVGLLHGGSAGPLHAGHGGGNLLDLGLLHVYIDRHAPRDRTQGSAEDGDVRFLHQNAPF